MKKFYIVLGIIIIIILLSIGIQNNFWITQNNSKGNISIDINPEPLEETEKVETLAGYGAKGALLDDELSYKDMLTYAVQDEYLAHNEYEIIINKFGSQKPYSNIVLSEETHLSYLKELYKSYDLDFPEDTSSSHVVTPSSLFEAAQTGVQAEIDNIAMYNKFLEKELPSNIEKVFIALRDASENHLKAFQKQVDKLS